MASVPKREPPRHALDPPGGELSTPSSPYPATNGCFYSHPAQPKPSEPSECAAALASTAVGPVGPHPSPAPATSCPPPVAPPLSPTTLLSLRRSCTSSFPLDSLPCVLPPCVPSVPCAMYSHTLYSLVSSRLPPHPVYSLRVPRPTCARRRRRHLHRTPGPTPRQHSAALGACSALSLAFALTLLSCHPNRTARPPFSLHLSITSEYYCHVSPTLMSVAQQWDGLKPRDANVR